MATAKKDATKIVQMKPDVATQIEALKADVALLAEAVKIQTKEKVLDTTETVKEAASAHTETTIAKYDEITSKAETTIKAKPLTSIAVAVGAGLLLGALTRR